MWARGGLGRRWSMAASCKSSISGCVVCRQQRQSKPSGILPKITRNVLLLLCNPHPHPPTPVVFGARFSCRCFIFIFAPTVPCRCDHDVCWKWCRYAESVCLGYCCLHVPGMLSPNCLSSHRRQQQQHQRVFIVAVHPWATRRACCGGMSRIHCALCCLLS